MAKAAESPSKQPVKKDPLPKKKSKKKARSKQKSKQKPEQIVLPSSYFELSPLLQQIRIFDYKNDYLESIKRNIDVAKKIGFLLKAYPEIPLKRVLKKEADLCLKRVNQLHFLLDQQTAQENKLLVSTDTKNTKDKTDAVSKADQQEAEMREQILKCIVKPDPSYSWDDIKGLTQVVEEVKETIYLPLEQPEVLHGKNKAGRSIMLFGSPGCGKTFIMKVIAADSRFTVFNVSAASLLSKWHGESQKMVHLLYKTAWEYTPSIIFIDEFDSLFGSSGRSGSESSHTAKQIQTELLRFLDGIETPSINETVTIVATNRPRIFSAALLRRFDKILYVAAPGAVIVRDILYDFITQMDHTLTNEQFQWLAHELRAYTPAEMKQIFVFAYYRSFRSYTHCDILNNPKAYPQKITFTDFRLALKSVKPVLKMGRNGVIGQPLISYRSWNEANGKPELRYNKHYYETSDYYEKNPVRLTSVD